MADDTKVGPRTIRHAAYAYTNTEGARLVAFRGDTVDDLTPEALERGEKFGAFALSDDARATQEAQEAATPWTLDANGVGRTDDGDVDPDWMHRLTVAEFEQLVANHPEVYGQLRSVEEAGRARKGILDHPPPTTEPAPREQAPAEDAADAAAAAAEDRAVTPPPTPADDSGDGS